MEQLIERGSGQIGDLRAKYAVWELRTAITQYLSERGVGRYCNVTVHQKEEWFELEGTVDSHWTRCVLFSLVPEKSGRRYIIDKLQVVAPPTGKDLWV